LSAEGIARARTPVREAPLEPERWCDAPDTADAFAGACRAPSGPLAALNGQGEIIQHWITGTAPADREAIEAYGLADPQVKPGLRLGLAGGALEPGADQAFSRLAPEFQAAARLQITLAEVRNRASLEAMEAMSAPAFLFTETGVLAGLSSAGEAMVRQGAVVTIRHRRLVAALEADRPALAAAIDAAIAAARGEPGGPTSSLALRRRSGVGGAVFDIHPLPGERYGFGAGGAALVVARVPPGRPEPDVLTRLYGLSTAEAEVANMIAEGASPEEIAAARGVAKSTVQSQIKSIFAKTGVNRQSQLVRLLRDLV